MVFKKLKVDGRNVSLTTDVRLIKVKNRAVRKHPRHDNRFDGTIMTKRICKLPNCIKPHVGLGYCQPHYYKFKRYGDPQAAD